VIEDGAILVLSNGGRIEIGEDVRIRTGAVLNVTGSCRFEGRNLLSWYSVVHCAYDVCFEEMAGTGEAVTVVDSAHYHGEIGSADEHWYGNHSPGAVRIGRNTWLASRSTVAGSVTLGPRTTVAGSAFVTSGSYAEGAVLRGVPARPATST
jgi:acetyltransferase-like isoleucine patch superfamily enzyme